MAACAHCGVEAADGAHFCANCGSPIAEEPLRGETRKVVTVMFMDAVESTALGERVDPESVRRVMTRYFEEIRRIVERHGGTVEKYIGDAVMAVFGVPTVHEDDAVRAVRAADEMRKRLAIVDADEQRDRGIAIAWRTGINTGEVVAGDMSTGQRFVTGDAVNVAARLEQLAAPGDILLGESTYGLVRDSVVAKPALPIVVKGISEPLVAYRLTEVRRSPRSPGREIHAPMIGREAPLRSLINAFDQVVDDRVCHLFTVLGEAGVGKTRLVDEFTGKVLNTARVLRGRCLPYGDGITYWPIVEIVRQAAGVSDADSDSSAIRKLDALVRDVRDRKQVVDRLAELIGVGDRRAGPDEVIWAVRRLAESLAGSQPTVVVLEDLHWAEPTLLDLVDNLSISVSDVPLLIICLSRMELLEMRPGWSGGKARATTVTLEPLKVDASHELVVELLGRTRLGAQLADEIAPIAEGNPLFVLELLRMLIDQRRLVRRHGRWTMQGAFAEMALPPTIHALLAARIDGLDRDERVLLERAAVEGQVFHIAATMELLPTQMQRRADELLLSLTRKELVRSASPEEAGAAGGVTFRFTHLLIRDAAYASIPKETRADLHANFADWLRAHAGERLAEFDEILGHHYRQAYVYRAELATPDMATREFAKLGAQHLGRAGRRAFDAGDVTAARKLLSSAAQLLGDEELESYRLRTDLALALSQCGDVAAADALSTRLVSSARAAGNEHALAYAELSRIDAQLFTGKMAVAEAIEISTRILEQLERFRDERGADRAAVELARQNYASGQVDRARKLLEERLATSARRNSPLLLLWLPATLAYGPTPVSVALRTIDQILEEPPNRTIEATFLAAKSRLLALTGRFDEARGHLERCVSIYRELGEVLLAYVAQGITGGETEILAGDYSAAVSQALEAYKALAGFGERGFSSTIAAILAIAYIGRGDLEEAERYVRVSEEIGAPDDVLNFVDTSIVNARVHLARGEVDAAEKAANRALELADGTDYVESRTLARTCLADVLCAAGRREAAIDSLRQAREIANSKGATVYVAQIDARLEDLTATPV